MDISYKKKKHLNVGGPPPRNRVKSCNKGACETSNNDNSGNDVPFSCMRNLIENFQCGKPLPQDKVDKAYKTFTEVTGYTGPNYNEIFTNIAYQTQAAIDFNSGYLYSPIMLLSLVIIWLGVGFGWFNWVVGLFLSLLAFVILYGFSIAYRIHAKSWLREQYQVNTAYINNLQKQYENSIAYWNQGLYASACAIMSDSDDFWKCNDRCNNRRSPFVNDYDSTEDFDSNMSDMS